MSLKKKAVKRAKSSHPFSQSKIYSNALAASLQKYLWRVGIASLLFMIIVMQLLI